MLSIPHLVVIFLVALVVLGPEKLPQVARMLGKAMADFRRITTDFRVQIEDEMQEMERQARLKKEAAAAEVTTPPTAATLDAPPPIEHVSVPASPADFSTGSQNDITSHINGSDHAFSGDKNPGEIGSAPPNSELATHEAAPTETGHPEKLADGDFDPA